MERGVASLSWSDLPKDLLSRIGKRLDTDVDVLRFRSVCRSWRSSIPHSHTSTIFPIKLPLPNPPNSGIPQGSPPQGFFHVTRSIIYRLQPIQQSSQNAFLVRFEEKDHPKKLIPFCPFSEHPQQPQPDSKVLNLLDFRISQVTKEYTPNIYIFYGHQVFCPSIPNITRKVVVLYSNKYSGDNFAAVALFGCRMLCFFKSGDVHWTPIDAEHFDYEDVIEFKGKFCAIRKNGAALAVDSSSSVTRIASELSPATDPKQLVESFGELLLIRWDGCPKEDLTEVQVKVYKLDESEGKWVQLTSLGDRMVCVFPDLSYSVYAHDLAGFERNSIYYADQPVSVVNRIDGKTMRDIPSGNVLVFNLEDQSIRLVDRDAKAEHI